MRYTGPRNRLARREGQDLFLKSKPVEVTKGVGMHGAGKFGKLSEFGSQLRSKQKAKRIYGLTERAFQNYYKKASQALSPTGVTLLVTLERRLDNVIFRAGFALTRPQARQMVSHGVFLVNGQSVNIPSFLVKEGDVITVKERFMDHAVLREMSEKKVPIPHWLDANVKKRTLIVSRLPEEEETERAIDIQAIIEFYSR